MCIRSDLLVTRIRRCPAVNFGRGGGQYSHDPNRYQEAGADCVYPIGVRSRPDIAALVTGLGGPVNGNTGEQLSLAALRDLGVARVSYGPRFYRAALDGLRAAVQELAPNRESIGG